MKTLKILMTVCLITTGLSTYAQFGQGGFTTGHTGKKMVLKMVRLL